MQQGRTLRTCMALGLAALCAMVAVREDVSAAGTGSGDSLARLKAGNATFVSAPQEALPIDVARREALVQGQTPFAMVLSCADSRVPPEVVFHAGLGDLFVVRAAGQVADRSVLASLEYGAEHLHVPLLVVLGHETCGAVKAAVETPAGKSLGPNLDYMLKAIRPAVARAAAEPAASRLRAAILANVEENINDLLGHSQVLKHLVEARELGVVGAYYELSSGRATFSEPVETGSIPTSTDAHK
jgi:carbonic anhydrase